MGTQYSKAGVDIAAGDAFVERISAAARRTHGPQVLAGLGGFAAHIALPEGMRQPVLVASTDGVGTKLRVAIDAKRLSTIGIDLVAMCANDLACSDATPLFFLDYFATGKLLPAQHAPIVEGIANGCQAIGCALVGGETAEMPGFYHHGDFDLAGFIVGVVERDQLIDGRNIAPGQSLIGVASSGFHSNGYALVRRVVQQAKLALTDTFPGTDQTVADLLLTPTHLYHPLLTALRGIALHGIAHITGGGMNNIPRIFPNTCAAEIDWSNWELPAPCRFIQQQTGITDAELRTVLNCGVGLVLVVDAEQATAVCAAATNAGFPARPIGRIVPRTDEPLVYV